MKLKVTRSTGNVFRDIGFSAGEAEHLLVRADLMIKVQKLIESKHLTQAELAKMLRISQPRVSDLRRGRIDLFSTDALIDIGGTGQFAVDDIVELLDLIGQPVILLLHSGQASSGWNVADLRPKLVKGIVAAEPVAPPMENTERRSPGTYTPGRLWGVTNTPITYDPR